MTGMRYIPFEVCCYVHKRAPKSRTSGFLKSETGGIRRLLPMARARPVELEG